MYRIEGNDGIEYGPVSAQQVRDWITEGRLNRGSRVQIEGGAGWQRLGDLAEFAVALADAEPPTGPPGQAATAPAAPTPSEAGAGEPPTSGLAISSLVLGVLGLVSCGVTSLVGLVLGIVALSKIKRSQGRLSGRGLAAAGICVSAALLVLAPLCAAAMLLPALAKGKSAAQEIMCISNLKQLNLGLLMYAGDNSETFPPADRWCDAIKRYVMTETPFQCPLQPGQRSAYAFNAKVAGRKTTDIKAPMRTVLTFSCAGGWNLAGGQELAAPHKHSRRFVTVGFADGHVETLPPDRLATLQWEP